MPRPDLIPSRGSVAEDLGLEVVRELTAEDLTRLHDAPKIGVPVLQKLRATHHRQAQLLASGKAVKEVAAIVGCTVARLVQLKNDPAFVELMAFYSDQIMAAMLNDTARLKDKLVDVGEMAVDELRERMENDTLRSRMATGDVRKIAEFAMDRTVAPPAVAAPQTPLLAGITINFGTSVGTDPALRSKGEVLEGKAEVEPETKG